MVVRLSFSPSSEVSLLTSGSGFSVGPDPRSFFMLVIETNPVGFALMEVTLDE